MPVAVGKEEGGNGGFLAPVTGFGGCDGLKKRKKRGSDVVVRVKGEGSIAESFRELPFGEING